MTKYQLSKDIRVKAKAIIGNLKTWYISQEISEDNRQKVTEEQDNRQEGDTQATTGEGNTQENTEKELANMHEISGEEDKAQEITEEDKSQENTEKEDSMRAITEGEGKVQEISEEEDNTQGVHGDKNKAQESADEDNSQEIKEEKINMRETKEEDNTLGITAEKKDKSREIADEEDNTQEISDEVDVTQEISDEDNTQEISDDEDSTQEMEISDDEDSTQEISDDKDSTQEIEISDDEDSTQEISDDKDSTQEIEIGDEEDDTQETTHKEDNTLGITEENDKAQEVGDKANTPEIGEEGVNSQEISEQEVKAQEVIEKEDNTHEIIEEETNTQEISEEGDNSQEITEQEGQAQEDIEKKDNTHEITEKETNTQEIIEKGDNSQEVTEQEGQAEVIEKKNNTHEITEKETNTQAIIEEGDNSQEFTEQEGQAEVIEKKDNTHKITEKETNTQEIIAEGDNSQEVTEQEGQAQEVIEKEDNTHKITEKETNTQEISEEGDNSQEVTEQEGQAQEVIEKEDNTHEITEEETNIQEIIEEDGKAPGTVAEDIAQATEEEDTAQEVRQNIKQQEVCEEAQAQDVTNKVEIPQVSDKDCKPQGCDLKNYTVQVLASTIDAMLHEVNEIEGKPHTTNTMEDSGEERRLQESDLHVEGRNEEESDAEGSVVNNEEESDVEGSVVKNNEESKAQESEPAEIHIKCASKKKTKHGEKRVYNKSNACVYCGKLLQVVIGRHLLSQHADELAVAKINALPKGKHRTQQLDLLRHKGNYYHNDKVLKTGTGELILLRRPLSDTYYNYEDYTPCPNCLGYVHVDNLWRHARYTCIAKDDHIEGDDTTKKTSIRMESEILKYKYSGVSDKLQRHVLASMQRGAVYNVLSSDKLILEYGNQILRKDLERKHIVSQKMRSVAKLVLKLRELDPSGTYISDFLKPSKFDIILEAADYLSFPDAENDDEMQRPSVPIKLGHDLAWLARIKRGQALRQDPPDETAEAEANRYLQLHTSEWGIKLASRAAATLNSRKCEKVTELPKTGDLRKLAAYLISEVDQLTTVNNDQEYRRLQEATLARLILFNKRRPAEMAKMKTTSITHPPAIATIQEIEDQLSSLEKHLSDELKLVKIKGKRGRYVPVIVPKECQTALSTIIMKRDQYGILDQNKYVFARRGSMTCLDGGECIAKIVAEMGDELESPEAIKTTRVRQYAATVSQVLALKEHQMRWLADHLGHDVNIHTHFYRLQESHIYRTVQGVQVNAGYGPRGSGKMEWQIFR